MATRKLRPKAKASVSRTPVRRARPSNEMAPRKKKTSRIRRPVESSEAAARRSELAEPNGDSEPPTLPIPREFAEPNSSVEPEELGRRFLRDATDPEGTLPVGEELEELPEEPTTSDVDLLTNSIHEASLFDQPTRRGTRVPHIRADESAGFDEAARAQAERNTRAVLLHGRSRAEKRRC
jgi:hypothetical protein